MPNRCCVALQQVFPSTCAFPSAVHSLLPLRNLVAAPKLGKSNHSAIANIPSNPRPSRNRFDFRFFARNSPIYFLPSSIVPPPQPKMAEVPASSANGPSPLCRCRVLYIGSAVPTVTKDGLQGIQQPLKERYPATESPDAKGIDSWLSVWYNGLLLEYVDGEKRTESAFFPINSLHYCAAVRYVNIGAFSVEGGGERFIPLDSPFAHTDSPHPPIFAAIFRRTTGVKVLECHGFVCTNEKAANALVRCCFHAYADTMYLKLDEKQPMAIAGGSPLKAIREPPGSRSVTPSSELNLSENGGTTPLAEGTADWNERVIGQKAWQRRQQSGEYETSSLSSVARKGQNARGFPADGRMQQELVPYVMDNGNGNNNNNNGFPRRTVSNSELRSPATDFFDSQHRAHPAGAPLFFGPPGMPPPFFSGPPLPPAAFLRRPPPHHLPFPPPPVPPHFFPPRPGPFPPPPGGPPHFGRIAPFPPFMMRPFFMMPPPFLGPHPPPGFRPRSPERAGPIITETAYDTFPRHNNHKATYEEPIYMPSANQIPPQASYKPGSFSPELYEHYYETYKQQKMPAERKNSDDASGDYWESGFEANAFRKARANERAFANTLAGEGKNGAVPPGNGTPKMNGSGSPAAETARRGPESTPKMRSSQEPGTSRDVEATGRNDPRPETPPADYEVGNEVRAGGHRMPAY